jgi:hypothetical protein
MRGRNDKRPEKTIHNVKGRDHLEDLVVDGRILIVS